MLLWFLPRENEKSSGAAERSLAFKSEPQRLEAAPFRRNLAARVKLVPFPFTDSTEGILMGSVVLIRTPPYGALHVFS